jgi:hypothetical protein
MPQRRYERHTDGGVLDTPECVEHAMRLIIADELDLTRQGIEAVAEALCEDARVVARHLPLLQAIDEMGQRCTNLALLLRSGDMEQATESLTLEGLQHSIGKALARAKGMASA